MKNCRGTASAYEVHIDNVQDIRMLTEPIDAIRLNFYTPMMLYTGTRVLFYRA